jgi:ubiquinone biosynthesis protein COQ9
VGAKNPYIDYMSTDNNQIDPSLKARRDVLSRALVLAAFDGWTSKTLRDAVKQAGLPKGSDALYFPDGPLELISFWGEQLNAHVEETLAGLDLASMKIRDNALGQGPAQIWAAADTIWRAIGDTSTDANYYSKRTILSGVISTSLVAWLADTSADKRDGRAFVEARIANVMEFEKAKWALKKRTENMPNPVELLGQLRYGFGNETKRRRRRSGRWT